MVSEHVDPPATMSEDDAIAECYIRMQGMLRELSAQLRQINARSVAELAEIKQTLAAERAEVKQTRKSKGDPHKEKEREIDAPKPDQFKEEELLRAAEGGDSSLFRTLPHDQLARVLTLRNDDCSLPRVTTSADRPETVSILADADQSTSMININGEEGGVQGPASLTTVLRVDEIGDVVKMHKQLSIVAIETSLETTEVVLLEEVNKFSLFPCARTEGVGELCHNHRDVVRQMNRSQLNIIIDPGGMLVILIDSGGTPNHLDLAEEGGDAEGMQMGDGNGSLVICERSLSASNGGPRNPLPLGFVRVDVLPSGYLIRPCEGGGSIVHIVDHVDLDAWSVPEVLKPLYESSKIIAQKMNVAALRHIRQIAQETSGEVQYCGGRQPAVLRTFRKKLCRGFNDAVNGFVDDGWSIIGNNGIENVTIAINSFPQGFVGSQYNSAMFQSFESGVLCAKASMPLQNVPPALLIQFLREHRSELADIGIDAYSAQCLKLAEDGLKILAEGDDREEDTDEVTEKTLILSRELLRGLLERICKDSQLVVDLYVNYDCDFDAMNDVDQNAPVKLLKAINDSIVENKIKMKDDTVDLESPTFGQGGLWMANKRTDLPVGSYKHQSKGYEEVRVLILKAKPSDANEQLVKISSIPNRAQSIFEGMTELNRVRSKIYETDIFSAENILLCAPTGVGKTNVVVLSIPHQVALNRNANGTFKHNSYKIVCVAPMRTLVAEIVGNMSHSLKSSSAVTTTLSHSLKSSSAVTTTQSTAPTKSNIQQATILQEQVEETSPKNTDTYVTAGTPVVLSTLGKEEENINLPCHRSSLAFIVSSQGSPTIP